MADYGGASLDRFFPPWPALPEVVELDSHWLLDLTASYDFGRNATVYVRTNNLLDEDYEQVYGYQTPGRSAYVGIRLSFGN